MDELYYIKLIKEILKIINETYNELGPGLSLNIYLQYMVYKFNKNNLSYNLEINLPLKYKGNPSISTYLINLIIENKIIIELITEEKILPVHENELLASMKFTKTELGLLINFRKMFLIDGIRILIFQNKKNSRSRPLPNSFKEDEKEL